MKLYTTLLSANGRKPVVLCRHLGIEPEIVDVNVYAGAGQSAEYLAIHPMGKIPTLVDNDLVLTESNAMLQYISERYGEWSLWGDNAGERADVSRWLFWESSQWQPALVPLLSELVGRNLQGLETSDLEIEWNQAPFSALARFLDSQLRDRDFLVGRLSLADISLAAMLMYVRDAAFPFDRLPNVATWYRRIEALEAWQGTAVDPWRS